MPPRNRTCVRFRPLLLTVVSGITHLCMYIVTDQSKMNIGPTSHSGDAAKRRSCTDHRVKSRGNTCVSTVAHLREYSVRLIVAAHMFNSSMHYAGYYDSTMLCRGCYQTDSDKELWLQ